LKVLIPEHGQFWPMKISGERDEWKNVQKNDKKKNTSDVIKSIIPIFSPTKTSLVCRFSKVDSRTMSRHQKVAIVLIKIKLKKKNIGLPFLSKTFLVENTMLNSWKDAKIGQGLGETKWKGVIIFVIFFDLIFS